MANEEHLKILKQGVEAWNKWRDEYPNVRPDLSFAKFEDADLGGANLSDAFLYQTNFRGADLGEANFNAAILRSADFSAANLSGAQLIDAQLWRAKLVGANLSKADLRGANLREAVLLQACLSRADLSYTNLNLATLRGADLHEASLYGANFFMTSLAGARLGNTDLQFARLIKSNLTGAELTSCRVYGISAWELTVEETTQSNLIITPPNEPTITVDNLEVAQFVYLLLHNERIRNLIDTLTTKVVLILGRFTPERKTVLDALREELRKRNYIPVVFDFDKPASRDLTETISMLAHMSRFIIADISEAKSIPQELQAIVPDLPSVAVRPIIVKGEYEYGMFEHFKRYHWVLPVYEYEDMPQLLACLVEQVITPAEAKVKELRS